MAANGRHRNLVTKFNDTSIADQRSGDRMGVFSARAAAWVASSRPAWVGFQGGLMLCLQTTTLPTKLGWIRPGWECRWAGSLPVTRKTGRAG